MDPEHRRGRKDRRSSGIRIFLDLQKEVHAPELPRCWEPLEVCGVEVHMRHVEFLALSADLEHSRMQRNMYANPPESSATVGARRR